MVEPLGEETMDVYIVTDPMSNLNTANFVDESDQTIE